MTTVLNVLIPLIYASHGFAQVASSSDVACLGACQAELVTTDLPGTSGDTELSASEVASYQRKLCEQYGKMKDCFLVCDGGSEAWAEFSSDGSNQVLQFCGLTGGVGDSSSADFQDMLCAQECQLNASEIISNILPQGPPSGSDNSESVTNFNMETFVQQNSQICAAEDDMEICILGCKGGQKIWETQFANFESSCIGSDGIRRNSCAHKCQQQRAEKIMQMPPQNPDTQNPTDVDEFAKKYCPVIEEQKACILKCDGGEEIVKDLVYQASLLDYEKGGNIIEICGMGVGSDNSSTDLATDTDGSKSCVFACQKQQGDKLAVLEPQNRKLSTAEQDEISSKTCSIFEETKSCLLKCEGGENFWKTLVKHSVALGPDDALNFVQNCGLGEKYADFSTDLPLVADEPLSTSISAEMTFDDASLPDLLCATTCQSASEGKITSALSGPDPETPDEISRKTKQLCDMMNVFKDCLTTCGPTGQQLWNLVFVNGTMNDNDISSFARACFPGQVPDEVLENYQCFVGTCTKCSDLPLAQCLPDFLVYPTMSACENSECGKFGGDYWKSSISICKMDGSTLGASEINLQCNPNVPAAGCPPTYACLPFEVFGAHYCCPDTPEQAQILCMQKCSAFISSQQSRITSLIAQPDAFHDAACSLYQDEKDCILKCPSGQQGFDDYQQKQLSGGDTEFYQNLVKTCGSAVEAPSDSTLSESVQPNAATSETSPQVAEYCRRVLNQKNGNTTFCKYRNFSKTCKNVCPQ